MRDSNLDGDGVRLSLIKLDEVRPGSALSYATAYGEMGLCVVPNAGKRPRSKGWSEKRPTQKELPELFADAQNVGLANGELSGGLVAVDMDVPEAIEISDLFLPKTLRSGREGTPTAHAWYLSPDAKTKKWQDTDGKMLLELRADGCQTLAEPSVHYDTEERYRWNRAGLLEAAEADPENLERRCAELATATAIARHMPPVGGRHEYAMAVVGLLLRRLDKDTVRRIVRAAWRAAGADSGDALRDLEGILGDTERRLEEGENAFGAPTLEETASGLPKALAGWWDWRRENGGSKIPVSRADEGTPTHDEVGDRWLTGRARPVAYGQSEWREYEAGYWTSVHDEAVNAEIDAVLVGAKHEGIRPNAGMRSSVERMARAKAYVSDEKWDADGDILVCANGTLEISKATLREHRPEDYALGTVPYAFDPDAEAPAFREFLESTVPDAAPFLQEYAGYSLTTDTFLEMAVWLQGPPGSGKSTYIEAQKAMLGPRVGLLGLADVQRSRFALADLPGKTLVVATEQPSDFVNSTHVLNAVISGEEVTVEKKFKDAHTVVPRAKILWGMNDTPRVKDPNNGLFRRVKVVSFSRLRTEPDPGVKERIKAEGQGILVWALEGLRRLRERGRFEVPGCVRAATEEFRRTSDVPGMFVEEACVVSDADGCEEKAQRLYEAYRAWCKANGHKPMSSSTVSAEWARLGFRRRTLHGRALYVGVKVDEGWWKAHGGLSED